MEPIEFVRIQEKGSESWGGVAAVDRGDNPDAYKAVAQLVAGDLATLLLFVCIGRFSHGEDLLSLGTLGTLAPFATGWITAAALLGGYGPEAWGKELRPAAGAALKSWAVGLPLALALRSLLRGYLVDVTFVGISMGVTGALMTTWRLAFAKFLG